MQIDKTNKLLPTGKLIEKINDIDVTLVDVAVPMMVMRASDVGKTGYETSQELTYTDSALESLESCVLELPAES